VLSFRLAPFRNKAGNFLDLRLGDASGEIAAKMWDRAEATAESLAPGVVVECEGRVEEYKGARQLVLGEMRPLEAGEYELGDFVRCSARPREEMLDELLAAIEEIKSPHLHGLLEDIFGEAAFLERFANAPGASKLHHAYVGGLLEHTLAVAELCRTAAATHPGLNRDLLLTGALLHDVGKLEELGGMGAYDYTDEGRLVGHVVLTDRFVLAAIGRREDFPARLALFLTHMLLSHHGELEWGAPVKPKLAEALALHYADNLDAKVRICEDYRESAEAGQGEWSEYHRSLERNLYLGSTEEAGEEAAEGEPDEGHNVDNDSA
jgi:3'-5' exoribonuclease